MVDHPLVCLHENDWGEIKATMKNLLDTFSRLEDKICNHIREGESPGGTRDRVSRLEWEVSELKKRFWWSAIIGGVIGTMLGSGSSEAITLLVRYITKG